MEHLDPRKTELLPEESGLMSLVELQKFLADELAGSGAQLGRAFRPLTDGLGLQPPPPRKEAPGPAAPRPARQARPAPAPRPASAAPAPAPVAVPVPPPERALASVIAERPASAPERPRETLTASAAAEPAPVAKVRPPPVPKATFFRRLLAGLVDQCFVLTVLGLVLLITSFVLSSGANASPQGLLAVLGQPAFLRFAALGFSSIWMCYLVVGVGILDMTFGMWVWGLRINYHSAGRDGRFVRKIIRIVCSFFFLAPVAPALLLAVRVNGRNLLDFLSGSYLYRTSS